MKAKVLKVSQIPSHNGGVAYLICCKSDEGKSLKTWAYPTYGNFPRWKKVIDQWESLKYSVSELWLDGLVIKSGNLIDADSQLRMELV